MWTLALETTSAEGSLALLEQDDVRMERRLTSRAYASELFIAVDEMLGEAGLVLGDIDLFAASDGPGSFTGVRIGLTAVKGWIEVLNRPAVTVSTLRAVAGDGVEPLMAALDGSRGEIYFGVYPGGGRNPEAAGCQEGLESVAEFQSRRSQTRWRTVTPHVSVRDRCPGVELVSPQLAGAVGRLGLREFRAGRSRDALTLDARYIRMPDAVMP